MGKRKKRRKGGNVKVYAGGDYGYSWAPQEPKKVLDAKPGVHPEVWAGPWSSRAKVEYTLYLSLVGEKPRPRVMVEGLNIPSAPTAKGVAIDWPDMATPDFLGKDFWLTLAQEFAREGGVLYVGCMAGKGRTGTALAILVGLWGISKTPIAWVREHYTAEAVETTAQAEYVARITGYREDVRGSTEKVVYPAQHLGKGDWPAYGGYYGAYGGHSYGRVQARSDEEVVQTILDQLLPKELKELQGEGFYIVEAEKNGDFIVNGVANLVAVSRSSVGWAAELIEGRTTYRHESRFLAENEVLRRFLNQEEALVRLLEAMHLDPSMWRGGEYIVGDVEISPEGKYLLGGRELTLEQARAYLLGVDEGQ